VGCLCLREGEGEGDGGVEELEGTSLDGSGVGEFGEALPGERDGIAGEGSQVCDQSLVVVGGEVFRGFSWRRRWFSPRVRVARVQRDRGVGECSRR
jgi:hypothetical protein